MTIKEILEIESSNTSSINLFKEDVFWRVYNQSAYYFVNHIKELKVLKMFYKIINCEVIYSDFPDTILSQIEILCQSKGLKLEKYNEKHYCISNFELVNGFDEWKNSIKMQATFQGNKKNIRSI